MNEGWTWGHTAGIILGLLVITKVFPKLSSGAIKGFADAIDRRDFLKADRLIGVACFFAPIWWTNGSD